MSGTIPLSMTQQLNELGAPLSGGKLYLIQAGTVSTPQNGYQDPSLTLVLPNPITLDAAGRLPQFFLADGFIKIRLLDSTGIVQREADNIQVIGPSSGGGGGTIIDPNAVLQTGDMVARYSTGARSGFVRANALTMGNATSGASERSNADTQALFIHLYNVDSALAVSGGRTGNALNDFNASKTIALPDWRGRAISGLDDMGNAAAGRLTASYFGATATVLGAEGGAESRTLTLAQIPSHQHTGTTIGETQDHTHPIGALNGVTYPSGAGIGQGYSSTGGTSGGRSAAHTHDFTTSFQGSGAAHATVSPRKLATIYLKL